MLTLQKSIDLTPLLPRAGPTGGLGLACPAPTMILTIMSTVEPPRALDILARSWSLARTRDVSSGGGGECRLDEAEAEFADRDVGSAIAMGQIFKWGFDGSQDKLALSDRGLTSCAAV